MGVLTLRSCEVAGWCETSDGWAICAACNDLVVALCPSGRSHGVLGLHSGWSSLAGAVRAVRVKLVPSWSHHRNCRLHFLLLIILSSVNYSSYQPIILAIIGEITFPLINLNNKCQYLDTWNLGSHLPAGFKHYSQLLATHKNTQNLLSTHHFSVLQCFPF